MDLTPQQEAKAWRDFSNHDSLAVLHNQCLARIEELRTNLEAAPPEELKAIQGQVRETRRWLEILHSKQSKELKKNYEHEIPTT